MTLAFKKSLLLVKEKKWPKEEQSAGGLRSVLWVGILHTAVHVQLLEWALDSANYAFRHFTVMTH